MLELMGCSLVLFVYSKMRLQCGIFFALRGGSTSGLGKVKRGGMRRFEHMEIDSKRILSGGVSRLVMREKLVSER